MSESNIPESVRARAAAADDLIKTLSASASATGGTTEADSQPVVDTAVTETEGVGMQPTPVQAPPSVDAVQPAPNAELEALRQQLAKAENDLRTWRGRYDAELPRERDARIRLEAEIESLRARITEAPAQEYDTPEYKTPTKDELENYGQDMFDIAKRYIMADVTKALAALETRLLNKLESVNAAVGTTKNQVAQTAKERFLERLGEAVKDWQKIDSSQEFNAWLDEFDPLYNLPRRNALDMAVQSLNDVHTARIFTAFLSQQGVGESQSAKASGAAPASGTEPPEATAQQPTTGPTLEDFAAPGKPSPSQTPEPAKPGAKVWTVAEIQSFYREVSRGAYRSRPEDKDRIERDIAEAQREGRVKAA
jgi:predicted  nucleic acid-binding Zn-ribbon protein